MKVNLKIVGILIAVAIYIWLSNNLVYYLGYNLPSPGKPLQKQHYVIPTSG